MVTAGAPDGWGVPPVLLRAAQWAVPAATVALWVGLLLLKGSVFDLSIGDYVARSKLLPRVATGDPQGAYRNWSMLPLVLAKVTGASTPFRFALVQYLALVVGTAAVTWHLARTRNAAVAVAAMLAVFSTTTASYTVHFAGSYDQLLVVVLCGAVVCRRPLPGALAGIALGLTHAEIGAVVAAGLAGLAWGRGAPGIGVRLLTLAGVVVARLGLTVWFAAAGASGDRASFLDSYGLDQTLRHFGDTWPVILWTALAGGWLVVGQGVSRSPRRAALVVIGWIVAALLLTAATVDQTRVAGLLLLPLVLALAVDRPSVNRTALGAAAFVGLASPFVISLAGSTFTLGGPFEIHW